MKKIFFFYFILISLSAFAQDTKDTTQSRRKWNKTIFISPAINSINYFSSNFVYYLFENTQLKNPLFISGYKVTKNTLPEKIEYTKHTLAPLFSVGLEFNSFEKKVYNLIDINYQRTSGNYSYYVSYDEKSTGTISPGTITVHDSTKSNYIVNMLSIGYKLQPTFKYFFLSIGITCSLNLVKIVSQKKEQVFFYPYNKERDQVDYFNFINTPFQIGAGTYIKTKKIILKPALYFSPYIFSLGSYNYNTFTASVGISYQFKK
jgi:hypothetical protein